MSGEAPLRVIAAIERKDDATKLVALLSDRRADPDEQNEYGETPLLIASRQGSADLCAALLAHGAVVDETDGAGFTSLHRACDYGHIEVVRALLAHSPNVNAITNRDRLTPCHLAARRGFGPIVRTLVGAGADLSRRDSEGRRPVDEAARYGHKAVVDGIASSFHGKNVTSAHNALGCA